MMVVISNYLPPAVRGRMKLWFIEPRANVFISNIKDSTSDDVLEYLMKHCPASSGAMIFRTIQNSPGFEIKTIGNTTKKIQLISGYPLILEKYIDNDNNI